MSMTCSFQVMNGEPLPPNIAIRPLSSFDERGRFVPQQLAPPPTAPPDVVQVCLSASLSLSLSLSVFLCLCLFYISLGLQVLSYRVFM